MSNGLYPFFTCSPTTLVSPVIPLGLGKPWGPGGPNGPVWGPAHLEVSALQETSSCFLIPLCYLSIYLSICLSVCLSVCLLIYLPIYLCICCLPIYISIHLSIGVHTHLSTSISLNSLFYVYISIYTPLSINTAVHLALIKVTRQFECASIGNCHYPLTDGPHCPLGPWGSGPLGPPSRPEVLWPPALPGTPLDPFSPTSPLATCNENRFSLLPVVVLNFYVYSIPTAIRTLPWLLVRDYHCSWTSCLIVQSVYKKLTLPTLSLKIW